MQKFTVRTTGDDDLDRVQHKIKAALDELATAVAALNARASSSGGGGGVPGGFFVPEELLYGDPASTGRAVQSDHLTWLQPDDSFSGLAVSDTNPVTLGASPFNGSSLFTAILETGVAGFGAQFARSDAGGIAWNNVKSRGTRDAPTAVLPGDSMVNFLVTAYSGSHKVTPIGLSFVIPSDATIGATTVPMIGGFNTANDANNNPNDTAKYTLAADTRGNAYTGSHGIAGGAVDGFFYLPALAAAAAGTPNQLFGSLRAGNRVPLFVDTLTPALRGYFGGSWQNLTGSGGLSGLTNKDVLYATGPTTVGQDNLFQYDHAATTLSVPTIVATLVEGDSGGGNTLSLQNSSLGATEISLTASGILVTGDLLDFPAATHGLGTSLHAFASAWATTVNAPTVQGFGGGGAIQILNDSGGATHIGLSSSSIETKGSIAPLVNATDDLGTSSKEYRAAYVGTLNANATIQGFGGGSALSILNAAADNAHVNLSASGVELKGDIFPSATTTYKLGSSSRVWSEGWFTTVDALTVQGFGGGGAVQILNDSGDTTHIGLSASSIETKGTIVPLVTATDDIGSNSKLYNKIHTAWVSGNNASSGIIVADDSAAPVSSVQVTSTYILETTPNWVIEDGSGNTIFQSTVNKMVFFQSNSALAVGQQTVTGSRGGNAALASFLTAMANYGLIIDSTTP